MKLEQLIKQARTSVTCWSDCDHALTEVNEAYGSPFEAARDKLNSSLLLAEQNGIEIDQLQGSDSPFRFPDLGAMVVVRISRLPTPNNKIETIDLRIERLERELKLAKNERKRLLQQLKIKGHEFVTEKITTAFKHIIK